MAHVKTAVSTWGPFYSLTADPPGATGASSAVCIDQSSAQSSPRRALPFLKPTIPITKSAGLVNGKHNLFFFLSFFFFLPFFFYHFHKETQHICTVGKWLAKTTEIVDDSSFIFP